MPFDPDAYLKELRAQVPTPAPSADMTAPTDFDPDAAVREIRERKFSGAGGADVAKKINSVYKNDVQNRADDTELNRILDETYGAGKWTEGDRKTALEQAEATRPMSFRERWKRRGEAYGRTDKTPMESLKSDLLFGGDEFRPTKRNQKYGKPGGVERALQEDSEKLIDMLTLRKDVLESPEDMNRLLQVDAALKQNPNNQVARKAAAELLHKVSKRGLELARTYERDIQTREQSDLDKGLAGAIDMVPYMMQMAYGSAFAGGFGLTGAGAEIVKAAPFVVGETIRGMVEKTDDQYDIGIDGELVKTGEAMGITEAAARSFADAARQYMIEKFTTKLTGGAVGKLSGVAGKGVGKFIPGAGMAAQRLAPYAKRLKKIVGAIGAKTGVDDLATEIFVEEYADAFTDAVFNISQNYDGTLGERVDAATSGFIQSLPEMAISMMIVRGGQYAGAAPFAYTAQNMADKKTLLQLGADPDEVKGMSRFQRRKTAEKLYGDYLDQKLEQLEISPEAYKGMDNEGKAKLFQDMQQGKVKESLVEAMTTEPDLASVGISAQLAEDLSPEDRRNRVVELVEQLTPEERENYLERIMYDKMQEVRQRAEQEALDSVRARLDESVRQTAEEHKADVNQVATAFRLIARENPAEAATLHKAYAKAPRLLNKIIARAMEIQEYSDRRAEAQADAQGAETTPERLTRGRTPMFLEARNTPLPEYNPRDFYGTREMMDAARMESAGQQQQAARLTDGTIVAPAPIITETVIQGPANITIPTLNLEEAMKQRAQAAPAYEFDDTTPVDELTVQDRQAMTRDFAKAKETGDTKRLDALRKVQDAVNKKWEESKTAELTRLAGPDAAKQVKQQADADGMSWREYAASLQDAIDQAKEQADAAEMEQAAPAPAEAATAKEPWEMTQREFLGLDDHTQKSAYEKLTGLTGRKWRSQDREYAKEYHEMFVVKQALAEGKPVPAEVLADYPDLQPAQQQEQAAPAPAEAEGNIPETGKSFKFTFVRNTEKAPDLGSRFGQDIEPAGRYMQQGRAEDIKDMPGWTSGEMQFENPLVIKWGADYGTPGNWKNRLSQQFGGKTGEALSDAIRQSGHDGIVTIGESRSGETFTSEIVDLGKAEAKQPAAATAKRSALHRHYLSQLKNGPKTGDALRNSLRSYEGDQFADVRSPVGQVTMEMKRLIEDGIVETAGQSDAPMTGPGFDYAGPGSSSPDKVKSDDPRRTIYRLTEKGKQETGYSGEETKTPQADVPSLTAEELQETVSAGERVVAKAKNDIQRYQKRPRLLAKAKRDLERAEKDLAWAKGRLSEVETESKAQAEPPAADQVEQAADLVDSVPGVEHIPDASDKATSAKDVREAKQYLLDRIDEALQEMAAVEPALVQAFNAREKISDVRKLISRFPAIDTEKLSLVDGMYVFTVPKDGTFKVNPTPQAMFEFRNAVKARFSRNVTTPTATGVNVGSLSAEDLERAAKGLPLGEIYYTTDPSDFLYKKLLEYLKTGYNAELKAATVYDGGEISAERLEQLEKIKKSAEDIVQRKRKMATDAGSADAYAEKAGEMEIAQIISRNSFRGGRGVTSYGQELVDRVMEQYRAEYNDIMKDMGKTVAPKKPLRMDGTTRPEKPAAKPVAELPERSVQIMNEAIAARDVEKLTTKGMLDPKNKAWRQMFESETGVSLPKTISGTRKAVVEWAATPAADSAPDVIEDFGEKIGGARKDMTPSASVSLSDGDLSTMPFSQIWPKSEVDAIEDVDMAALATAIRNEIPTKPRKGYKLARWVEHVKMIRTIMDYANKSGYEAIVGKMRTKEYPLLSKLADKIDLLRQLPREQWNRIGMVRNYPDAYTMDKDGTRTPAPYAYAELDGRGVQASSLEALPQAVAEKMGTPPPKARMEFEIRYMRDGQSAFINKKGDPLRRKLMSFTGNDSVKEAREFMKSNRDALAEAWERVKDADNVKETDLRREDNMPRTAADYRKGKDVTPQMFADAFGFRGVEFGKWVTQGKGGKDRQGMLNDAFDALMDLSDILGIPSQAMSLNGELGIGFGSRGSGWASAHYEPDKVVINLTKTRGAGTLAHEWFHALDHYFQRQRKWRKYSASNSDEYITFQPESYYYHPETLARLSATRYKQLLDRGGLRDADQWKPVEGVRPEVEAAFVDLVNALNHSPMKERSALIDKGKSGGYWSRVIERAARAFENYTIHKMAQKGYQNDYLANVVKIEEFQRDKGRYPYLLDAEIAPVADAFDALFSTIQTRETEKGVEMFRTEDVALQSGQENMQGYADQPEIPSKDDYPDAKSFFKALRKYTDDRNKWAAGVPLPAAFRTSYGFALVTPAMPQDKLPYRLTYFQGHDSPTPSGHAEYYTKEEAIKDAGGGYDRDARFSQSSAPATPLSRREKAAIQSAFKRMTGSNNFRFIDKLLTPEGKKAVGRYWNQWVEVVEGRLAADTANHEAVHYAIDNLLAPDEKARLLKVYTDRGLTAIDAEERLAEDFVLYARRRTAGQARRAGLKLGQIVRDLFEKVISALKAITGNVDGGIRSSQDFFDALFQGRLAGRATATGGSDSAMFADRDTQMGFYSGLEQAVEDINFKSMPASELVARLKKTQGVKQEELDDLGLFDWLDGVDGKVSKEQVLEFIRNGGPQIQEVTKGIIDYSEVEAWWNDEGGANQETPWEDLTEGERQDAIEQYKDEVGDYNEDATKFGQYQLPGGENYREVLMTLPVGRALTSAEEAELETLNRPVSQLTDDEQRRANELLDKKVGRIGADYKSSHWDEPNVLAHVRLNDRTDADGKRVLFIEEIQSDWHQAGRKKGYKQGQLKIDPATDPYEQLQAQSNFEYEESKRVPDAPFKKSWPLLAFKRVLRMAAEQGYDSVAWTPGDVQAERYDLSKQIDSIGYSVNADGTYDVRAYPVEAGKEVVKTAISISEVEDFVGKEVAEKIQAGVGLRENAASLRGEKTGMLQGENLKVGGEGMKGFYDKMLPSEVGKYIRKLDKAAKVATAKIGGEAKDSKEVWSLPITDTMREQVMAGQAMYRKQDAEYLAAVESGDMEAAQRMVDEAAKAAGYNVGPVWHGTDEPITQFERQINADNGWLELGIHFGTREQAENARIGGTKNLIRTYIKLKKPLIVPVDNELDSSWTMTGELLDMFEQAGLDTSDLKKKIKEYEKQATEKDLKRVTPSGYEYLLETPDTVTYVIRPWLKAKGYDGIIYPNAYEGEGESYIVFDGEQVAIVPEAENVRYRTAEQAEGVDLGAMNDVQKWFAGQWEDWTEPLFKRSQDVNAKPEISKARVTVTTIFHYAEKVPALKRLFEVARNADRRKHEILTDIFGPLDHQGDVSAIHRFLTNGVAWNRRFAGDVSPEGRAWMDYIIQRDRDAVGPKVVKTRGGFKAVAVDGSEIGTFNTEDRAWDAAHARETQDLMKETYTVDGRELKFSRQAADALARYRKIADNAYSELMRSVREYEAKMEELGIDVTQEQLNLFAAMREMGDRRGYYMPRRHGQGRFILRALRGDEAKLKRISDLQKLIEDEKIPAKKAELIAEKEKEMEGVETYLRKFDTRRARNFMKREIAQQGWKNFTFELSNTPSEYALGDMSVISLNDILQKSIETLKAADESSLSWNQFGLTMETIDYELKDGGIEKHTAIRGNSKRYNNVFKALGGRWIGKGQYWYWTEPSKELQSEILKAVAQTEYGTLAPAERFGEILTRQVAALIQSHGSRSAKIGRSDATGLKVTQGYDEDPLATMIAYGTAVAGGSAKREMAQSMMQIITGTETSWEAFSEGKLPEDYDEDNPEDRLARQALWKEYRKSVRDSRIDSATQENAYNSGVEYMKDMIRNETSSERIMGTIKGIAAFKFLTGVAPVVVNMSALATNVPAAMKGFAGIGIRRAPTLISRGLERYGRFYMYHKFGQGQEFTDREAFGDKWLFDEISRRGYDEAPMTREALGVMRNRFGATWSKLTDFASLPFSVSERFNRAATIAATYWGIREQHKGEWTAKNAADALEKAHYVSDQAHGVYGKVNLPDWARGSNALGQVARSFYTYKTFTHNYLTVLAKLGFQDAKAVLDAVQNKDAKALREAVMNSSSLYMAISPMVLGGVGAGVGGIALTFMKAIFDMVPGAEPPDDLEEWIWEHSVKVFGEPGGRLARQGVIGLAGINVKGSLAIRGDDFVPTSIPDLFGAPYAVFEETFDAAKELSQGNVVRAAELMAPRVARGPLRAFREAREGVTNKGGSPVYWGDEKVTPSWYDTLVRSAGFNPASISEKTERQYKEYKIKDIYDKKRSEIYRQIRMFKLRPTHRQTRTDWAKIIQAVEEYNARVDRQGHEFVPRITDQSIKGIITRASRPNSRERKRD